MYNKVSMDTRLTVVVTNNSGVQIINIQTEIFAIIINGMKVTLQYL